MQGSDLLGQVVGPASKARPTHVRYWVAGAAGALAVIIYLHRMAFALAIPKMGLTDMEASWLSAIFLVAYGAFEVPGGMLADRFGSRLLLTLLVLGWSLMTAAVAGAAGLPAGWIFPFLLLIRGLFGVCQAGAFPALSRMLTDWLPRQERATAQGGMWMATRLGGLVIPLIFAWLVVAFGDWPIALIAVSLVGVVWAMVFWPWFRDQPADMPSVGPIERDTILAGRNQRSRGRGASLARNAPPDRECHIRDAHQVRQDPHGPAVLDNNAQVARNDQGIQQPQHQFGQARFEASHGILRQDALNLGIHIDHIADRAASRGYRPLPWSQILSVLCLCLMYGGSGFAANFFVTLLPKYLADRRHLGSDQTIWLTSIPFACGMVGCILGGLVSDGIIRRTGNRNLGRRLAGSCGFALGAVAWLLVPQAESVLVLGALLGVIFFCNDLNMAPAWASCSDVGERHAGTIGGAMNMTASVTGALGNLLTGYLLKEGQDGLLFILFASSFALSSLCWFGVDVTKPLADKPSPRGNHVDEPV